MMKKNKENCQQIESRYRIISMKIVKLVFLLLLSNIIIAQEEMTNIEKRRFQSMVSRDTNFLIEVLDEDLVYTHSNGLQETKKEFIQSVSSKNIIYDSIEILEQHFLLKKKLAIITGLIKVKGKLKGKEFSVLLRYTDMYIKKSKWKLIAWQSAKI